MADVNKNFVFDIIKNVAETVAKEEDIFPSGNGENKLNSAVTTLIQTLKENSNIPVNFLEPDILSLIVNIIVLIVNIIKNKDWGKVFELGKMIFELIGKLK